MDFKLSDEQKLLRDSVDRFIQQNYTFEQRQKIATGDRGMSTGLWRKMGEIGLLGLPFSEDDGGFGAGAVELMLVMEAFGRGLVVEPYLPTIVLAGGLLAELGSGEQKASILKPIIAGEKLAALAFAEPQSRYDLANISTLAEIDGSGYRLSGHKSVVLGGAYADTIIISARTSGNKSDSRGVSLFVINSDEEGLEVQGYRTMAGQRAAEIMLNDVAVGEEAILGEIDAALPALERIVDRGTACLCAEAVGSIDALISATRRYLGDRSQFGRPIGSFQVLQHRLADMFMSAEEARSMMLLAILKMDADDPIERARAASAAKVQIGRSGKFIGAQAVQLHGGMGVSDEMSVGHYFKRLTMIASQFGDESHHRRRFASLS